MKFYIYSLVLAICISGSGSSFAQSGSKETLPGGIIKETYKMRQKGSADLNLFLRYPSSGKEGIKGVLAICKYSSRGIEKDLAGGTRHFNYLIEFADQHHLATVGFGPPGRGWDRTVNSDLLSTRKAASQDKKLDGLSRDLSRSIERFARKYQLPQDNWLLYGLCGGAQYAHRMALRQPQHFKAVHVHYGGSYDIPTPAGKSINWLVTSHADEPAYIAAQRFYQQSREMNYNMILKGYTRSSAPEEYDPEIEYTGLSNLQQLSLRFFEHALTGKPGEDSSQVFIADYVNGLVVPAAEGGWIPRSQAVILPSRELAEAWGSISK